MLISFTFSNYLSFFKTNKMSMIASKDKELKDFNVISTEFGDLLKNTIIFGANSSGKTNVLKMLKQMKKIVLSDPANQSYLLKNRNYFALSEAAMNTPTVFEVEFLFEGVMYQYGFEILHDEVIKEYFYKKNKRKYCLFMRSGKDCKCIEFPNKEMDNVKSFSQHTRPDNLFMYWAIWGNNPNAKILADWFSNLKVYSADDSTGLLSSTIQYLEGNKQGVKKVLKFLRQADDTINSFDIITDVENQFEKSKLSKSITLKMNRTLLDNNSHPIREIAFEHDSNSAGTNKLFEIAGPIIESLENGHVVLIDEIDSHLHPLLVKNIIAMFNSIHNNPKNAQLICNTHNALLLEENIRRDQIYFTEKDDFGVSTLYSLSDFKGIRKVDKLMKKYLIGIFGATPEIDEIFVINNQELSSASK